MKMKNFKYNDKGDRRMSFASYLVERIMSNKIFFLSIIISAIISVCGQMMLYDAMNNYRDREYGYIFAVGSTVPTYIITLFSYLMLSGFLLAHDFKYSRPFLILCSCILLGVAFYFDCYYGLHYPLDEDSDEIFLGAFLLRIVIFMLLFIFYLIGYGYRLFKVIKAPGRNE